MILVFSPQPALERVALVDPFQPGQAPKKPMRVSSFAGGNGLRAARVARLLGGNVLALSFAGGQLGNLLRDGLEREQIEHVLVPTATPTRGDFLTLDREQGIVSEVPDPPRQITQGEAARLLDALQTHLPGADLLLLSGGTDYRESLNPEDVTGAPDLWASAFAAAKARNVPVLADVAGAALHAAVQAGAWLVRVNLPNLQKYTEISLMHDSAIVGEARRFLEQGVQNVVVTLGEEGALLIHAEGVWRVKAPVVSHFNPTGSGETLSGALAVRYGQTGDLIEAVRYGCAAASVNVTHDEPGYATPGEVGVLFPRTIAAPVPA